MNKLTDYQKSALRYDKHISLTANAGSGKTTVLTNRFIEILIRENISINNIVAITFTEKAASELYSKIAKGFDERIKEATGNQKNRLEYLRRSLVSAKISTIHSFCIDILKDYSPLAGIDANFSPIDARLADDLLDQSIDEVLRTELNLDSKFIKKMMRIFGTRFQVVSKIKELFHKRKSTEELIDKLYSNEISDIAEWFRRQFEDSFEHHFGETVNNLISNINVLNSTAADEKENQLQKDCSKILSEISEEDSLINKFSKVNQIAELILTSSKKLKKRGYISAKTYSANEEIIIQINKAFEKLKDIVITKDYNEINFGLAEFGKQLIDFYQEINKRYSYKKYQLSYLDFEDLLLLTQKLLTNRDVKNALSEKYKYIMIDEYQDTNEIQYKIFMPILNHLKSGNLFVVGDEKQSIYMFREAEVEIFNKTKNEIKKIESDESILNLPHSFRLAPNIALFTNVLFGKLFGEVTSEFNEVQYSDLICAYNKPNKGNIDFLICTDEDESEADLLAQKILSLINNSEQGYKLSDVTILCSRRKNFSELERSFVKYNIPYNIVGGKGFYQQQLVLDIYNYLSFIINPKNDTALATILRGPFFSLSDTELLKISLNDKETLFQKLSYLENYKDIVNLLISHISFAKKLSPSELIRKISADTGIWNYAASKPDGEQEIANLEKLIQKAIHINAQGFSTMYDFVLYLNKAINTQEDEGFAELDSSENAVKIMTIHQSKGLEFKIVVLFKTNQTRIDESLKAKDIIVDKNYGILTKLPLNDNYFEEYQQAPVIGIYNYLQNKKADAEFKRLLYVAVTRAEEYLIISTELKRENFNKNSFAEMIFNTLGFSCEHKSISVSDNLIFIQLVDDKYELISKPLELTINIENRIEELKIEGLILPQDVVKNFNIHIEKVNSLEKNEIISASKISLFLNCPRKYQLTYEFGYGELTKHFYNDEELEFSYREDELRNFGSLVGSISHSVLEQNSKPEDISNIVLNCIQREESILELSYAEQQLLLEEITNLLTNYYESASYKLISNYNNFKNEIEFYKKENDYYLYGIIDKLIKTKDRIIIVDYKSDKISKSNLKEKSETYLNQLLFYSYIILNKYPEVQKFELKLIFLRDDKFSISVIKNKKEIKQFGETIKGAVQKIRLKDFSDQPPGCNNMKYYLLDKCK